MFAQDLIPVLETQFLLKAFLLLFLLFYFFFSLLLIRQVQIMAHSVKTDLNNILKLAAFVNFIAAAAVFILVLFS